MSEKYNPGYTYYVDGGTLNGLLKIASQLSGGEKIDANKRRDLGQWMQVRLDQLELVPSEEASEHFRRCLDRESVEKNLT